MYFLAKGNDTFFEIQIELSKFFDDGRAKKIFDLFATASFISRPAFIYHCYLFLLVIRERDVVAKKSKTTEMRFIFLEIFCRCNHCCYTRSNSSRISTTMTFYFHASLVAQDRKFTNKSQIVPSNYPDGTCGHFDFKVNKHDWYVRKKVLPTNVTFV